jgi:hypothetical protein
MRKEKDALRVGAIIEDEKVKFFVELKLMEDLGLAFAAAGDIPWAPRVVERMKDRSFQVTAPVGRVYLNMSHSENP